ncbi:unnamed protein product [Prunus armeniaca]
MLNLTGTSSKKNLRECLPDEIVQMILSIHADFFGSGLDKRIWKFTPIGDFSVKSAYNTFSLEANFLPWQWEFLCKLKLPPKIKTFLWLLFHKKLLTNNQRQRRGLASSAPCPSDDLVNCHSGDFDAWLLHNLKSKRVAGFVLPSSGPHKLILQYAMVWFTACKPMLSSSKKCGVHVHWHAPLPGFFNLNTDGSWKSDSGAIGAGGLIRNSAGNWIKGFSVNLGVGSTDGCLFLLVPLPPLILFSA